jgi:hypothetical protein
VIKAICSRCKQDLVQPGALVFSPPEGAIASVALKFHICGVCWPQVALFVQGIDTRKIAGRDPVPSQNPMLYPITQAKKS